MKLEEIKDRMINGEIAYRNEYPADVGLKYNIGGLRFDLVYLNPDKKEIQILHRHHELNAEDVFANDWNTYED